MDGETVSVALCIDTSGSIDDETLGRFLNELRGILRAYPKVDIQLYACDAKLHGPWQIDIESEDIPKLPGGGGTDFRPFFQAPRQNHRARCRHLPH